MLHFQGEGGLRAREALALAWATEGKNGIGDKKEGREYRKGDPQNGRGEAHFAGFFFWGRKHVGEVQKNFCAGGNNGEALRGWGKEGVGEKEGR